MTVTHTVVREFEVDLVVREVEQVAHDVVSMTLNVARVMPPAGEEMPFKQAGR